MTGSQDNNYNVDIYIVVKVFHDADVVMTLLDSIIRKRIGASIYCVIPQLGDFRYSDLMRLSGIF